ncbi:ABC transporter substrate-binding protein [Amycolatopsis rubida]|uniref:ABC transporter substrate-binding protein n=1 Tax=Amycolatopsis rubida TaxID=112413 RepID=A0ABX0BN53_9PSEU|nr:MULTISPECIES: ABC transporter substrate-binding protein [Amycolatopsis]MYW90001.1 transporter substrate-binding protein [Amycolatopsis rubida]NEC54978.1 ABC transporter substrate-binding protein [Amycolatopsis rubida]OAP29164.1 Periplasmic dipeptide transport protein precursor [Amycolatopsis sp. M39]
MTGSAGLSRRGFLLGATGVLAAGCGGRQAGGGTGIDTFSAVLKGSGTDERLDPGTSHLFIDEARLKALYDGLFEVDDTMRPVPRLARAAEPNADGTRWRLSLRDARWHDGAKFTSADVLYTLSRVLGPPGPQPFIAAATLDLVDLSQSREVDDQTVEIALKQPSFEFLTALSAYGTRIVRNGTKDFKHPIGTGPFRFESFRPGREMAATAYDDYWDGAPKIRRLRVLSAENDARPAAVRSGQADFADDLTPAAAKTLRAADGIDVRSAAHSGIYYFAMKTDRPPFDNPDVRRAMMRMVDREELVKVALQGEGEVANDVFGKGFEYYADLPPHTYDPDEAKALLREAGAQNLAFELFTAPAAAGFVEAANLFAEQAKRSGVTVKVRVGSGDTYYSEALKTGELTMGQSGPLPIPNHFASRLLGNAPQNRTNWHDPEFDALYRQALSTAKQPDRAALYRRMHEILHDRGGFVFWGNSTWNSAASAKYRGIPAGVPNSLNWVRFDKVTR